MPPPSTEPHTVRGVATVPNGRAMPIRLIIRNDHAFSPEEADILIDAFEESLQALNLTDREDPLTLLVAKKIIELAKEGERDPARLRDAAVASFK
jgi:hypothetical protein